MESLTLSIRNLSIGQFRFSEFGIAQSESLTVSVWNLSIWNLPISQSGVCLGAAAALCSPNELAASG